MFRFEKKNLIKLALALCIVLTLVSLNPVSRQILLFTLKFPLILLKASQREAIALFTFHRNFFQSENLRKQIDLLNQEINALKELETENERLKRLLSLGETLNFKVIVARVVAHSPDSWSHAFLIDKGTRHGVAKGMTVMSYLGLLGRIIEANPGTSKVLLVSDPNFAVSALVQRSRQEGLVCGTLGGYLMMRYLPADSDVNTGDTVVTSGLNGRFPKGLVIGSVVEVRKEFSDLNRYAIIKPATPLSSIEEILVVIQ
ncbi:MAG: rod shape-determining protein MreC [Candidatus Omnitrophota bacterium]